MQDDVGTTTFLIDLLDFKFTSAATDPAYTFRCIQTGTARFHSNFIGHNKAGVETHPKLANQLGIGFLITGQLGHKVFGA